MGADIKERLPRWKTGPVLREYPGYFLVPVADIDEAAAEIGRLRGEVEALRQCGIKYLGWLGVKDAENGLRKDMADPEMVDRPAPAMPNGVEVEGFALNLAVADGALRKVAEICPVTPPEVASLRAVIVGARALLRAADNRDAAGVGDPLRMRLIDLLFTEASAQTETGITGLADKILAMIGTPAAVPAGEAVAYSVVQVGNRGAAYDPPNTHRAFTYEHQPGNIDASRLGRATAAAAVASTGDSIDRGLSLLKELQALGFGVFQIGPPAPVQAAPQEGEQDTSRWPLLDRVEFALRDAGFDYDEAFRIAHMAAHPSACELGAVLTEIRAAADSGGANEGQCYNWWRKFEAALQHRGDSQEVGRV